MVRNIQKKTTTPNLLFALLDGEGRATYLNRTLRNVLGINDDGLPLDFREVLVKEEKKHTLPHIIKQIQHLGYWFGQTKFRTPKNKVLPVQMEVDAQWSATGELQFIAVCARDLTMQQRVEERLDQSEGLLRSIFEHVPVMAFVKDHQGRYVAANNKFDSLTGFKSVISLTDHDIFPHSLANKFKAQDQQVMLTKSPLRLLEHLAINDEQPKHLQTVKLPYLDKNGDVVGIIGFSMDVTELIETKETLVRLKNRYKLILQSVGVGILGIDTGGRISFANETATTLLGIKSSNLVGQPIHWLFHNTMTTESCQSERCPICSPLRLMQPMSSKDFVFWRQDGTKLPVEFVSTPITNNGKSDGSVIVFADITDKKAVQHQQERLLKIIEESPHFISTADANGYVFFRNPAAKKMLGITDDAKIPGTHMCDRRPAWAAEEIQQIGLPTAKQQGVWSQESAYIDHAGREIPVLQTIIAHKDDEGGVIYLSTIATDISDRKRIEAKLLQLAVYDPLTGLLNRTGFQQAGNQLLNQPVQNRRPSALLYMDLDGLKSINNRLGHDVGDDLLRRFAAYLQDYFHEPDVVARIGGDEFVVLQLNTTAGQARQKALKFLETIKKELGQGLDSLVEPGVSIGIASYPEHGKTVEELLANADSAMYDAKYAGGNRVAFFGAGFPAGWQITSKATWEERISNALTKNQFRVHWQPVYHLRQKEVVYYELLLRLPTPQGTNISPGQFLPIASRLGFMQQIDLWMVKQALNILRKNHATHRPLRLGVNLSGKHLTHQPFITSLKNELKQSPLYASNLIFEITERDAIDDLPAARQHVQQLQKLGCGFALDDFGVGFASLDLLRQLPVNLVKIDGSFIQNLDESESDRRLLKVIVEAVKAFGKLSVAEYIEKPESLNWLRKIGVDYGQGFYLGHPEPVPTHIWSGS